MSVSFFHTMFVARVLSVTENLWPCRTYLLVKAVKRMHEMLAATLFSTAPSAVSAVDAQKTHEAAARRSGPRSAAKQRLSLCGPGRIPLGPSVPTPALRTARLGPRSEPSSALVNGQRCSPSQQALIIPCCFSGDFSLSMLDIETMQIESRSSRAQSYRIERPRLDN